MKKKPQDLGWGFVRGSNGGAGLTAGRIPHPNSSSNRYSNFLKSKVSLPWSSSDVAREQSCQPPATLQVTSLSPSRHCKLSLEWVHIDRGGAL